MGGDLTEGSFPRGVFAPVLTPFLSEELDLAGLCEHVRLVLEEGPHGIVVGGSGGEFLALTLSERHQIAEVALAAVGGAKPTIVAVAAYATREVVELARHAEGSGATALLVTAPYLMRPPQAAVRRHFAALRDATDLPLMLYNTPAATGIEFSRQELEYLVDEGIFQAIKMSFPEAYRLRDLKLALGDRAAVYCGHDGSALESLVSGADGWISCVPVLFPRRAVELWDAVQDGADLGTLRELWGRLLPFVRLLYEADAKVAGDPHWLEITKAAANMLGHPVGECRAPLGPLAPSHRACVARLLEELATPAPATIP